MKYTKTIRNLGVSTKDFKILNALDDVGQSKILPLEEVLQIPRTSISYRLRRMSGRNLVEKIKVKNHFEWKLTEYSKNLFLRESGNKEFKVTYYNKLSTINKIIEKIMKDKTGGRIYFIEPYKQTKKYTEIENIGFTSGNLTHHLPKMMMFYFITLKK